MHDLASTVGHGGLSRSLGRASAFTVLLLAGTIMPGQPAKAGDETAPCAEVLPAEAEPAEAQPTEAEQTAKAYRAVFDRLPTDLEPLEHVPSGRGLDSWKLFVDHPELVPLAEALVAIAERESCDFASREQLLPSTEHHQPYNRAKNLLLHRMVTKLLGDRTVAPDDFGRLPEPVGVDKDAARRYGVAVLNMAVHFGERGTLAERRVASVAVAELMGVARRTPHGLPWAMDTVRASRFVEPLENLFGYQAATITRLRLLARAVDDDTERFIEMHRLTPTDGDVSSPLFAATLERHRWAYNHAADTLEESWDIENPTNEVLAVLRSLPRDLEGARTAIIEIVRSVAEVAAVREDVRAMLRAFPADEAGGDEDADNDNDNDNDNHDDDAEQDPDDEAPDGDADRASDAS